MITIHSKSSTPPFIIRCKEQFEAQGHWLAQTIDNLHGRGQEMAEGTTIQVGWSLLKLIRQLDGTLALSEPDFDSNPFVEFRPEVSTTLRVLLAQNDFLSTIGTQGVSINFNQKVILQKGALDEPRIVAQRQDQTEQDSGWYIGPAEHGPEPTIEELEAIFIYQLLALRPTVLPALCLPPGFIVAWNGSEIEAVVNGENRNVWPART